MFVNCKITVCRLCQILFYFPKKCQYNRNINSLWLQTFSKNLNTLKINVSRVSKRSYADSTTNFTGLWKTIAIKNRSWLPVIRVKNCCKLLQLWRRVDFSKTCFTNIPKDFDVENVYIKSCKTRKSYFAVLKITKCFPKTSQNIWNLEKQNVL